MVKAIIFDCFGVLAVPDNSGKVAKNTALLEYIETLKPNFKIGILSNMTDDWVRRDFLNEPEQALFDDMVFSYEVGVAKPAPAIFELACDRLGVEPSQAIMIDDIARYVDAAQETGLRGIVYQNLSQMQQELTALLDTNH
jgi:HAD superfamily hydrolase (TIGR01549 family)